jgi:hypothetical protein
MAPGTEVTLSLLAVLCPLMFPLALEQLLTAFSMLLSPQPLCTHSFSSSQFEAAASGASDHSRNTRVLGAGGCEV